MKKIAIIFLCCSLNFVCVFGYGQDNASTEVKKVEVPAEFTSNIDDIHFPPNFFSVCAIRGSRITHRSADCGKKGKRHTWTALKGI